MDVSILLISRTLLVSVCGARAPVGDGGQRGRDHRAQLARQHHYRHHARGQDDTALEQPENMVMLVNLTTTYQSDNGNIPMTT